MYAFYSLLVDDRKLKINGVNVTLITKDYFRVQLYKSC